jgi:hypothetical protein
MKWKSTTTTVLLGSKIGSNKLFIGPAKLRKGKSLMIKRRKNESKTKTLNFRTEKPEKFLI